MSEQREVARLSSILTEPYKDDHGLGVILTDDKEYNRRIYRAFQRSVEYTLVLRGFLAENE